MSAGIAPDKDSDGNIIGNQRPFSGNDAHSFKGTGVKGTVAANSTGTVSYTCDSTMLYDFSGIEVLGAELGDLFQLKLVDVLGQYGVGAGMILDQFGINWNARPDFIKNLPYVSRIMGNIRIDVIFTNNSNSAKTIYVNLDLHKVTTM